MMTNYYRDRIMESAFGDLQLAFDLMVRAAKGNEKLVWDILGQAVIEIIKRG